MGIVEAAESLLSGFSDLLEALKDWAEGIIEKMAELCTVEPGYKAPVTLDRPFMGLKYPETFKYLKSKKLRGVSYG